MNSELKSRAAAQIDEALEAHFAQVRYAHAALLARSGHLLEAEALLCRNGAPTNLQDMDLLARIAIKQRDLNRAKRLWQDALRLDRDNRAYMDALVRIEAIERFQDLVSPSANLKRLAKLAKWAGSHFVVIVRWAGSRLVATAVRAWACLATLAKAVGNLRKTKPSEPVNAEPIPAGAEMPPERSQASAFGTSEAQLPLPSPEKKSEPDVKT